MVNWSRYLASVCNTYAQWWQVYTLMDVVGRQRVESEPSPLLFDFGLMVQTVEREKEEKIERLTVLEGLRKYASEHVLLVGRPGSGKSTALVRLLLEEAEKNLTPQPPSLQGKGEQKSPPIQEKERGEHFAPLLQGEGQGERSTQGYSNQAKIPVLVELRYYRTSILDLIQDFLQRHDPNLKVDAEMLKTWLRQGQLLLLLDGLNELPSEEARRDLHKFRQDYQKTTPMIFTTRDLGVGGDLDITKKLEMQPLSEAQMQQFVRAYLPEQGNEMLRQLGSRLREFGQTPLLLWMLCSLFRAMGKVPPNLGLVFRQFTQSYYGKLKQDVPVTEESRDWCQLLLERLAFRMTQGREKTQLQVAISKQEAEEILTGFLRDEGLEQPRNRALKWLKDLLKHHLIQLGANNQIEFRHQLIQEYYTAEYLLKVLTCPGRTSPPTPLLRGEGSNVHVPPFPRREGGLGGLGLSDDELKREYLNYLKWTESLALMLELVEDEAQAVRVVKLALEVDLRLGARLAGAVKPQWQEQTVGLVAELEIPQLLKLQLLGLTKSENAISLLIKGLEDENAGVRGNAVKALGEIGSEATISRIIRLLEDEDYFIQNNASEALCRISSEATLPTLFQLLEHTNYSVRLSAVNALGHVNSETAIYKIFQFPAYQDRFVRGALAYCFSKIPSEAAISQLIQLLQDEDYFVSRSASEAMGQISSEAAMPKLIQLLEHKNSLVRSSAANALGNIGSDAATIKLIQLLEDEDYFVRYSAVGALGKIGSEAAIPKLIQILENEGNLIDSHVVEALGRIGSEAAIPKLIQLLEHDNHLIRSNSADALGKIGSKAAIPKLVQLLKDEAPFVRSTSARAVSKIGGEAMIPRLIQLLEDNVYTVRAGVAEALGISGSGTVVSKLIQLLEDENSAVRKNVSYALGEIGSEAAIHSLIKLLQDRAPDVRESAAISIGKIGSLEVVNHLTKLLENKDFVADYLGNTPGWLTDSLQSIQNRYKFYNYALTQLPQMEDNPKSEVKRDQVFISYSHKDAKWLDKLQTMLKPMMRNNTISVWADTQIKPGSKWRDEIEKALKVANVAVLMVSPNFLASDFITKHELPPLLNAAEQEGLKIIWVPVSYCLYEETEIGEYQAAHSPSQPLESLKGAKLNQVLAEICREIKAASTATT